MQPLRHSYTNRTLGDGATVVKCYQGPDAPARSQREHAMLHALRGQIPVPPVLSAEDACLTMTFMTGIHGQELLEAGHGGGVLRACGTMLRRIHQLDAGQIAAVLPSRTGEGQVLVHGDYSPNNVLLDLCHQQEPGGPGEAQWAHRLAVTRAWQE